jgi:homoserine dehydrogenase
VTSGYYLRLRVADEPGVLADITRILADAGISIDAMLQKESSRRDANGETDIILLTHETREKHVNAAIARIESLLDGVEGDALRMEALN